MNNIITEQADNEILVSADISDEMLEAAMFAGHPLGAYTQFAFCTNLGCPALPRLDDDL